MTKSIFEISEKFQSIFNQIEDADGELTPELEEELKINQEDFTNKVKSYCDYISELKADLNLIKEEAAKLKAYKESKERTINRLSKIVATAISQYGTATKTGGMYVDWKTGKASIRNTKTCEVNQEAGDVVIQEIWDRIIFASGFKTLDYVNEIDVPSLIDTVAHGDEDHIAVDIDESDIDDIKANITIFIDAKKLLNGSGFEMLKYITKANPLAVKVSSNINKTSIKEKIEAGETSNLGHVTKGLSLNIK